MTPRLLRLQQVLLYKEQAVQEAGRNWLQAKEQFTKGKMQHDQLITYRHDYVMQLHNLGDIGCTLGRMRNRIDFIGQLDGALSKISQQLASLAKQRSHFETLYMQAKAEQDAVINLIKRVKEQENERQMRQEQKESDEYAQKQWYSKNSSIKSKNRGD